jgi:hypothetical protein
MNRLTMAGSVNNNFSAYPVAQIPIHNTGKEEKKKEDVMLVDKQQALSPSVDVQEASFFF